MAGYLFGVQYIFFTNFEGRMLSDDEIERDLENMVKHGVKVMRLTLMWADVAVSPGRLELSRADYIMDVAHEKGLGVQVAFLHDSAPSWAVAKYPDARYVSAKGERVYFTLGRAIKGHPGLCLDHPGVRRELEWFYRSVVERYRDHPALHSWEPWTEVWFNPNDNTIYESEREALFCYCENTVRRFRKWLARRYGSVEALNEAWLSSFSDWSEVEPPRFRGQRVIDWLDWKQFLIENQVSHLRWLTGAIRGADPEHPVYVHVPLSCVGSKWSKMESKLEGFYMRDYRSMVSSVLVDDWEAAPVVDVYGLSLYPTDLRDYYSVVYGRELTEEERLVNTDLDVALNLDAIRCACERCGRDFTIAELPGQLGGLFEPWYDEELYRAQRAWSFMGLARGSKGVLVWEWRHSVLGTYAPSYGLCDERGTPTERAAVAAKLAEDLERVYEYVRSMERLSADVALVFSPRAYIYDWAHFGDLGRSRYSLLGYYRALWELNYPVDIAHIRHLDGARGYKLLVLPWPVIMSDEELEAVLRCSEGGCKLLVEARFAAKDERGLLRRELSRDVWEALGCELGEVVREAEMVIRPDALSEGAPPSALTVPTAVCSQVVEPRGGRVIGTFRGSGRPAAVASERALTVGTFLGLAYVATGSEAILKMVDCAARWAGARRAAEVRGAPKGVVVEVQGFRRGGSYLFIVVNHSKRPTEPVIEFNVPRGEYSVTEVLSGERLRAEGRCVRVRLGPRGVAALYLEPA